MNRVSILIAVGAIVVVLAWFFVGSFDNTLDEEKAAAVEQNKQAMAGGDEPIFGVKSAVFDAEIYRQALSFSGRSKANDSLDVKTEVAGRIAKIHFKELGNVKKGDVLAEIEPRDIDVRIAKAETDVEIRREEFIAEERLVAKGASGELRKLQAEGALKSAEATLINLREQKKDLVIKAPLTGVVSHRYVVEGEAFGKSAPIARIVAMDPILVEIYVTLEKRRQLKTGYAVEVDFEGEVRSGVVHTISTFVEPTTKTYLVEISVPNESGEFLVEGMAADVRIFLPEVKAHHFDASLLKLDEDRLGVMVVEGAGEDLRAKFVEVELLADDAKGVWVSGLDGSQRIITAGSYYVDTGDRIAID